MPYAPLCASRDDLGGVYIYIYSPPLIMVDLGSTDWISEKTVRQKAVFKGYRVTVP